MSRYLSFDRDDPAAAIGRPVWGNNIRQVGRIIGCEPPSVRGALPMYQVRWVSGKVEWRAPNNIGDLEQDINAAQVELATLLSARDKALRA